MYIAIPAILYIGEKVFSALRSNHHRVDVVKVKNLLIQIPNSMKGLLQSQVLHQQDSSNIEGNRKGTDDC
jgi:hypothetical protein